MARDRGIIDTSVLIDDAVCALPGILTISVITLAELHFGTLAAPSVTVRAARLHRLARVTARFDSPLPVDEAVAESYALLAAQVAAIGRKPRSRTADLLIAATAHAHDAALYTCNASDLVGFEDLIDIVAVR